jgi:hypothetical protein
VLVIVLAIFVAATLAGAWLPLPVAFSVFLLALLAGLRSRGNWRRALTRYADDPTSL